MKGYYTEKNVFLIGHTFLYENYNLVVWVRFLKYLKICSFSGHGLLVNLNQHKIIYRLGYKTSNFEKLEFLVSRKLHHFEFGQYHMTDPNTFSNHQKLDQKIF